MARKKKSNKTVTIAAIIGIILLLLLIGFLLVKHPWSSGQANQGGSSGGSPSGNGAPHIEPPGENAPDNGATCYDNDMGINWAVSGYCEDSTSQTGHADGCHGDTAVEWYCNNNHACESTTKACNYPVEICADGRCQQEPCEQIFNPSDSQVCMHGSCPAGFTCSFYMATLTSPAHCGCVTSMD